MTYFEARARFIKTLTEAKLQHIRKHFSGLEAPDFEVMEGRKYDKIVQVERNSRSSFCWLDRATGDILKGSWKCVTEKTPRGNIFNDDCLKGVGPYGVNYLNMSNQGWGW